MTTLRYVPTSAIQARWQLRALAQRVGLCRHRGPVVDFPSAEMFVETGHGHGDTFELAWRSQRFHMLTSIEVNADLAQRGRETFRGVPRVDIMHASSPHGLLRVCDPEKTTVFWLDAHFSGHVYAAIEHDPAEGQCPLLAELEVIRNVPWRVPPAIYIDDVLMFESQRYEGTYAAGIDRAQFPTRAQIAAALPAGYTLTSHHDRYYSALDIKNRLV